MEEKIYPCAIVGGGIAGYSAALTLNSLRIEFLWLGREKFGEKLFAAERVRNFPSFSGSGAALADLLEKQRVREGIAFTPARIDNIYALDDGFALSENGDLRYARTVVLATGVDLKGRLEGEEKFLGRGVSYCAVCDGALYRGKRIAAVLSSAEFAEEAEYLAGFADAVECFCPEKIIFRSANITAHGDVPLAVEGGSRVERIVLKNGAIPVDGVFLLRNAAPPSALVGGLETKGAHVVVGRDLSTNLPGLFAAGDITGVPYQYAKAAGEGLVAAYSVRDFLAKSTEKQEIFS